MLKKLLNGKVLIEREQPENKTASGIYIPETNVKKPNKGKVVLVAENIDAISVDDVVLFSSNRGIEITSDGVDYLVLDIEDIIGVM